MSEVQSRPAASRGRGPARGGRGGFTSRGGSRVANKATNGDSHQDEPALEDDGEIGQLKQKFGSKVGLIKELFATWSDIDILYALQEADGDENLAVERIADGTATQWGEVSKQKKVPKTKAKTDAFTTAHTDSAPRAGRGGRTDFAGRGRGRGAERGGRGGARGKPANAPTNGIRSNEAQPLSVPTEESSAWETPKPADDTTTGWGDSTETSAPATDATPAPTPAAPTPSAAPKANVTSPAAPKTWASMLRQAAVPKPAPKPKEAPAPKPAEPVAEQSPPTEPTAAEPEPQTETPAVQEETPEPVEQAPTIDHPAVAVPEIALAPSHDQLTEKNLDQLADTSNPAPTETAASEAADSWNPRGADVSATATPLSGPQQKQESAKAVSSGYAATALKATERAPVRTPSYQRRVLDQEEAVRMPQRDQVGQAAVQFGAFSLNEDEDDIDGDREEPETRAQPPVDSPVTQPRASLPPVQPPASLQDPYAAQKPVSSLPPSGPSASAIAPPSQPSAASQAPTVGQNTQQYGRFGQPAPQEPAGFGSQKPYDAFGQQQPAAPLAQNQYEGTFGSQAQIPPAQSQVPQQPAGGFSSAPSDYSSYYTSGAQDRSQYNYYNQYAPQQGSQGPPEGPSSQQQSAQRASYMGGNFSAPSTDNLSQYPQSSAHSQRYGSGSALDNSGNTTPNPSAAQAPPSATGQAQPHGQQPHDYQQYGQNHPYFNSPYYAAYMNQYQGYGQGGYGGVYGKGTPYGQPGYGMNAQGPYAGHGTSPAGGFQSSLHRADSGGAAGLAEYGRAPAAQAASQPAALGSSGYGGMHDSFSRAGPYSQGAQSYNAAGVSQPQNPPVDDLKQFGDAKTGAGPSPSMGLAARPGSAANNAPSSGLPPAQSGQQGGFGAGASGYGGYPGQHAQAGGLHGAGQAGGASGGYGMSASGGNQGQHGGNNPYGGYGGQGGFGGNYGYGNQQQQQQRQGGWGGNYH